LYHLRAGHFVRFSELEADDDVAAVRRARSLLEVDSAELWCGRRRVTSLDPEVRR
jgi:hypothetical protein